MTYDINMSLVLEFSVYTHYYVVCLCRGTVRMANAIDARQNWGSILEPDSIISYLEAIGHLFFIYLAVRTIAARASRSPDSTRVSCRGEDGRAA